MNTYSGKNKKSNIKIIFFLFTLGIGGTERQAVELAVGLKKRGFQPSIYCLNDRNVFSAQLRRYHIPVRELPTTIIPKRIPRLIKLLRLRRLRTLFFRLKFITTRQFIYWLKKDQTDIVYAFGIYPYIFSVVAKLTLKTKIIWGIRDGAINYSKFGWIKKYYFWASIIFSRLTDLIIANSQAGKNLYLKKHYPKNKMVVIQNGIDIKKFRPDQKKGLSLRKQFGLNKNDFVIGHAARLDPIKDHPTFLRAVKIFVEKFPKTKFLIAGGGDEKYENELKLIGQNLGIEKNIIWLGEYDKMSSYYNAIDILTLTSISEGWANVLGEAMACGKPCVTTDVGDCALIVEKNGITVRSNSHIALSTGWEEMVKRLKTDPGLPDRCRQKIVTNFSRKVLVNRFLAEIQKLTSDMEF